MKSSLFKILLLLLQLAAFNNAGASGFSYVYIQGDKSVPFYVKFEDMMLPRYGKNYCIIPQLIPGEINIQVLFQQNSFPPQKFTIVVPENGFRGFLLLQKNGVFSLYDIQQQFYLYPGNKGEDDKIAPANTAKAYVPTNSPGTPPPTNVVATKSSNGVSPKFLPNVELSNERQVQPSGSQNSNIGLGEAAEKQPATDINDNTPGENTRVGEPPFATVNNNINFRNSDCPAAINEGEFEDLQKKVQDKTDKTRLKFLLTRVTECYTSNQARLLGGMLNNDPERYTFLKKIYPRITDQYNFAVLEDMLTTQEWKDYFKLILPK